MVCFGSSFFYIGWCTDSSCVLTPASFIIWLLFRNFFYSGYFLLFSDCLVLFVAGSIFCIVPLKARDKFIPGNCFKIFHSVVEMFVLFLATLLAASTVIFPVKFFPSLLMCPFFTCRYYLRSLFFCCPLVFLEAAKRCAREFFSCSAFFIVNVLSNFRSVPFFIPVLMLVVSSVSRTMVSLKFVICLSSCCL